MKQSFALMALACTVAHAQPPMHAAMVTTSPTMGLRSSWDGSDLIVNYSSINEDVRLLKQRKAFAKSRQQASQRPLIEVSGAMTGLLSYLGVKNAKDHSDIDLDGAELAVMTEVNPWVTGLLTLDYDNGPRSNNTNLRVENSRLYLKRAFITVGNLGQTPWHSSLGQMYLPFGKFGSMSVSAPVTQVLGRTRARAWVVGYDKTDPASHFNASVYGFRGEASTLDREQQLNAFGANVSTDFNAQGLGVTLGMSALSNLANADAVAHRLGEGVSSLAHRVPGVDARVVLQGDGWSGHVEAVAATRAFASTDLEGIRPRAWMAQLTHTLPGAYHKTVGVRYGQTQDAQPLLMPKRSWSVSLNGHGWHSTTQTIEFRHNSQYDVDGEAVNDTMVLLQFGIFF